MSSGGNGGPVWRAALTSKTFWAGVGLIGLAVYQATQGHFDQAAATAFGAAAALGIRHAIAKQGGPPPADPFAF